MQSFGNIIAKYRKKNHLSQQELSHLIGLEGLSTTNKSISNWEKNIAEPSATMLMTICKILKITDLYGEYYGSNPDYLLSQLNERGKEKALDYISMLHESEKYAIPKAEVIPFQRSIRLYDIPASAGPGNFLEDSPYCEIEVGEEVPINADFGIHISGNSMEPLFIDGQIVWIHKQPQLSNGEIGIFLLDGEVYCKKIRIEEHLMFLQSLNPDYKPILITNHANFTTFGKVVG